MERDLTGFFQGFGAQLKRHRKAVGMNQTRLGAEVNVHSSVISRWENDFDLPPSPQKVEQIAQVLSLAEDEFHALHLAWCRSSIRTPQDLLLPQLRPEAV